MNTFFKRALILFLPLFSSAFSMERMGNDKDLEYAKEICKHLQRTGMAFSSDFMKTNEYLGCSGGPLMAICKEGSDSTVECTYNKITQSGRDWRDSASYDVFQIDKVTVSFSPLREQRIASTITPIGTVRTYDHASKSSNSLAQTMCEKLNSLPFSDTPKSPYDVRQKANFNALLGCHGTPVIARCSQAPSGVIHCAYGRDADDDNVNIEINELSYDPSSDKLKEKRDLKCLMSNFSLAEAFGLPSYLSN